jgi:hypothetical protein
LIFPPDFFLSCGKVLMVFLIPFGGGIPAGVVLAQKLLLPWPVMAVVYFISDLILAISFEPLMHLFIFVAKDSKFLTRLMENYRNALKKMGVKYGTNLSPLALVGISLGVDPMTGRAAAKASGHGFVSGWALAICGDMIFFTLISVSTIWLNNIIGDGTTAALIVMVAMVLVSMYQQRRSRVQE